MRGRGWNRGNFQGNSSNGSAPSVNPPVRPPEEEWDPEYTPKSRKYYLHDDREGEKGWIDNRDNRDPRGRGRGVFPRGRGRFVYRKGGSSPKWTHDMYQGTEEGELPEDSSEMEPKEGAKAGEASAAMKQ